MDTIKSLDKIKYECVKCAEVFDETLDLVKHVEMVHEKSKQFNCNLCKRQFTGKNALRIHVQTV